MAFYRRMMLLNIGGTPAATTYCVVAASIEEALSRGFLVEIDGFLRRQMGKPELEGTALRLQRLVWMCDANQSAITEFNAIMTSTFAQIVLERHALVFALGYSATTSLNVPLAFMQLFVEIALEVLVDNTAMRVRCGSHANCQAFPLTYCLA